MICMAKEFDVDRPVVTKYHATSFGRGKIHQTEIYELKMKKLDIILLLISGWNDICLFQTLQDAGVFLKLTQSGILFTLNVRQEKKRWNELETPDVSKADVEKDPFKDNAGQLYSVAIRVLKKSTMRNITESFAEVKQK
ncbi:hypothetical protein MAR_028828 [Mya arenaria]|uniref:Uncharacterized protein n=1 Tax=Mya arenaria TaxID=6604 RepID=A0ABY7DFT7_MYAAR|nr:hypothetical protein MAR_028828 [Mya arenaria]